MACAADEPLIALQGEWRLVDANGGTESYLDAASVEVQGKYVFARNRIVSSGVVRVRGFEYRSSIGAAFYNCAYHSWAPIRTVYFSDATSSVRAGEYQYQDDELAFRFPVPRSMGENLMREVCRLGSRAPRK